MINELIFPADSKMQKNYLFSYYMKAMNLMKRCKNTASNLRTQKNDWVC